MRRDYGSAAYRSGDAGHKMMSMRRTRTSLCHILLTAVDLHPDRLEEFNLELDSRMARRALWRAVDVGEPHHIQTACDQAHLH